MIEMDALRIMACVMVVVIHVVADGIYVTEPGTFQWYVLSGFMCIARPAVPVFFILSGMFMRSTDWRRGIRKALYYLLIYFTAMALYQLLENTYSGMQAESVLYVLNQGMLLSKYHLWFLEEYILLMLIAPVVNTAIERRPELAAYGAGLFVIGSVVRLTVKMHFGGNAVLWAIHSFLPDFDMGYAGYFFLGRLLIQKKDRLGRRAAAAAGAAGVLGAVCVFWMTHAASLRKGSIDETYYNNFYLGVFLMALAWAVLFLRIRIPRNWHAMIECIAPKTLGIYLIHVFVIETVTNLGFHAQRITTIIGVPLKTVLVLIVSFGLCAAWESVSHALGRMVSRREKM